MYQCSRRRHCFLSVVAVADTLGRLEALGHRVQPFITQTSIQPIEIGEDGTAFGFADPRRPDSAAVRVE